MKNFQDLTIGDYLGILRRRIWYLVLPTILVSIGACIYAWQQSPFYKSETTIQVTNRILPDDYIDSLIRETPQDRIEFVRQQIRSRTFLERLVQDLQFAGAQGNTDAAVAGLSASLTFDVFPPHTFKLGYVGYDPVLTQSVVRRLADRVMTLNDLFRKEVVLVADQFLDDELRQASIDLAAAEQRLREFNEQHFRGLPAQVDSFSITTLQSQLAAAESDLADSIQFREAVRRRLEEQRNLQTAVRTPPPRRSPGVTDTPRTTGPSGSTELELRLATRRVDMDRLSQFHPDRPRMLREIADLERRIKDFNELVQQQNAARELVATTPESPEDPVLPTLPGVESSIELAEAELNFELERQNRIVATKERAKQTLAGQLSQFLRRMNLPAELAEELTSINQELKSARDRHTLLATNKLNSEMAAKVDTNANNATFRVIDPANLPQAPDGPNRPRNALLGSVAGLLLGLGLVITREYVDTTLRDEEDAAALLKLPVLTSVPVIRGQVLGSRFWPFRRKAIPPLSHVNVVDDRQRIVIDAAVEPSTVFSLQGADTRIQSVVLDPRTIAGEQYRLMRTSLSLMRRKRDKLQTILISSTIPNEGKTFAACCLSAILAQESNKKVLLIDADFRTASASRMLGINGNGASTGLSEILRGEAQLESSIAACSDLNLYFLSAGRLVDGPTELLTSPSLEGLIRRCEELFDWIIIDSPPILALADANIMLPFCDSALLVVRAGKTPVKLIQDSVHRMGDDRICGVLMNGVSQIAPSRYYGHYYKYSG